jgi:hypothetical protein
VCPFLRSLPGFAEEGNKIMSRQLALIMLLSLLLTRTAAATPGIVDLALQNVGTGSVAEITGRIFNLPFTVYGADDYGPAIASLPQSIRENRISEGKLLRRVESIIRPVIELHHRDDKIELFFYRDEFARAMVWLGCVLVISDALAGHLQDDELAGIVAHEMGHAYFMIETIKARKLGDHQAMKIVELKCDAVAMLTLKLLGHDPAAHLKGLRGVTNIDRINGPNRIDSRVCPSIGERAQFAQRFMKFL